MIGIANNTSNTMRDDFNDFDSQNMLKSSWANGNAFDCVFSPRNVNFIDGKMQLKLDNSNQTELLKSGYSYAGAEYRTKKTYGYGYFSVKMRPIKNDGVVSSFFVYTGPSNGTRWDEIDIEFLGKDTTKVQLGYFTNGVCLNGGYLYDLGFDASLEMHEYGFKWTQNSICWYVDEKEVYQVTSDEYEIPVTPGFIMANVWNGKTPYTKYWLNVYDGTVPLVAEYDYFSYKSLISTSEPNIFEPDVLEPDILEPDTQNPVKIGTDNPRANQIIEIDPAEWFLSEDKPGVLKVYDNLGILDIDMSYEVVSDYIVCKLNQPIDSPKQLSFQLKYIRGSRLAIAVLGEDSAGNDIILFNMDYASSQKGYIDVDTRVEAENNTIIKLKLMINSTKQVGNVYKSGYRLYLSDFKIAN